MNITIAAKLMELYAACPNVNDFSRRQQDAERQASMDYVVSICDP